MFSVKNNNSGYSILEFALSFVLSVPVIFITMDLTKIMQARSVAKAAVSSAVRCLSVTDDPRCSAVMAAAAEPRYRVFLTTSREPIEPQVSYDGEVRYIEGPEIIAGPFNAVIPVEAHTQINGTKDVWATVRRYNTAAVVDYQELGEREVPEVVGGDGRNPIFQNGFEEIPFRGTSTTSSYSNNSNARGSSYSDLINIPSIYGEAVCLGENENSCTGDKRYVRGILHVKGTGRSSSASSDTACTKAKLVLEEVKVQKEEGKPDRITVVYETDLGGQVYDGTVSNFIPRGYLKGKEESLINRYVPERYTEAFLHKEIKFKPGSSYRIRVTAEAAGYIGDIKCHVGSGSFEVTGGTAYLRTITPKSKKIECLEKATDCDTPSSCTLKNGLIGAHRVSAETFSKILRTGSIEKTSSETEEVSCNEIIPNQETLSFLPKSELKVAECSCRFSTLSTKDSSAAFSVSQSPCPDDNFGVNDGVISGNILKGSEQAKNICLADPVMSFNYGSLSESQIQRWWTVKTKQLAAQIKTVAGSCSERNQSAISDRLWTENFPQYKAPLKEQTVVRASGQKKLIQTGRESAGFPEYDPLNPVELKKSAKYSCEDFRVRSFRANQLEKKDLYQAGYLSDVAAIYPNCFGSEDSNLWKNILANELRSNYKDTESAFFMPKVIIKDSISYTCGSRTVNSTCPSLRIDDMSKLETVVLEEDSSGKALPPVCQQECNSCQLQLKTINGSLKPDIAFHEEAARTLAREELNTFSPWMGRDCGESHCADISVNADSQKASARSVIKVPLFSKRIVNAIGLQSNSANYVEISEEAERPMERMIAAQ